MKSAILGGVLGFALVAAVFAVAGEGLTSYGNGSRTGARAMSALPR